ncbi:MAG: hypothetical protein OXG33_11240 [Chloroflexi bacterium]|nr:hypothetical protein [Chloroflexota bacterium]
MKRNASRTQGYQPRHADQQAHSRRWRGPRLDRDPTLRAKAKRGRRGRKRGSPASFIQHRRPLADRHAGLTGERRQLPGPLVVGDDVEGERVDQIQD